MNVGTKERAGSATDFDRARFVCWGDLGCWLFDNGACAGCSGAQPYIAAISRIEGSSHDARYGSDQIDSLLAHTVMNLGGWRGPEARAAKKYMREQMRLIEKERRDRLARGASAVSERLDEH